MNTGLTKNTENDSEKDFFKLMNSAVFGEKILKNLRKHREIKLIITETRRNYLVSEPNYHTTKFIFRQFISNRN